MQEQLEKKRTGTSWYSMLFAICLCYLLFAYAICSAIANSVGIGWLVFSALLNAFAICFCYLLIEKLNVICYLPVAYWYYLLFASLFTMLFYPFSDP
jgi:hypothetical protein